MNRKKEIDNFIELLKWLVNLNQDEEEIIKKAVETLGVKIFFLNIEEFDISDNLKAKLIDLRNIIRAFDGGLSNIENSEVGDYQ